MAAPNRNLAVGAGSYSAAGAAGRPRLRCGPRSLRAMAGAANPRTSRLTARRLSAQEFFDGREKFAQHDWLGDIPVAAAVERPALVARHRESSDRNDRDLPRLRVTLELADRIQSRDVRQLNVHQHQIGPMGTG